jgi:hypothetical protein
MLPMRGQPNIGLDRNGWQPQAGPWWTAGKAAVGGVR